MTRKRASMFKQGNIIKIKKSMVNVYSIIKVVGNEYNRVLANELLDNCAEEMKGEGSR